MEAIDRVLAKCARDEATGCLLWQGACTVAGYGHLTIHGKRRYVHVIAYVAHYGPMPEGLVTDHVAKRGCLHRNCVAWEHLEAVTRGENVRRGRWPGMVKARCAAVTHCPSGHAYTEENTVVEMRNGYPCRSCRTCRRDRARARRAAA